MTPHTVAREVPSPTQAATSFTERKMTKKLYLYDALQDNWTQFVEFYQLYCRSRGEDGECDGEGENQDGRGVGEDEQFGHGLLDEERAQVAHTSHVRGNS